MEQQRLWLLQRIYNVDTNPIVIKEGLYKIGRSPESNIFCKSEWVSRFHCDVTVKGGNVYIKDLGSLNGTYIEKTEILKERDLQLKDGDIISLGKPFLGEMPETSHYVYRLVECNSPQGPKKRKRLASLSPQNEELTKGCYSPKRLRESVEGKVSSSDKNIECIDLTEDGSENVLVDKPSTSGSIPNEGSTSPDSSGFKNPMPSQTITSPVDANTKIIKAVMKLLQSTQDREKVLKNIEILSGAEKFERNAPHNKSVPNQSIAGSSNSNFHCEEIISSNCSSSMPNKSSVCQPVEDTNFKIESDAQTSSVQSLNQYNDYVPFIENKEIHLENYDFKKEIVKKSCCIEADIIQSSSNLTHCPEIATSNTDSAISPTLSDLKVPNSATEKIPDEEHYKPLLKKSRSDSFTSEIEKLDSLLKGLSENKETDESLDHDGKGFCDPLGYIEDELKHLDGQNENISHSYPENIGLTSNIKPFHDSIDAACDKDLSLSKNHLNTSLLQERNAVIDNNQMILGEEDKLETVDSPSTSYPEKDPKDKLEIKIDSLSSKDHSEPVHLGVEESVPIKIKQELSLEKNYLEENMVFSQDIDGVVVIDESEDELEYSQLFMEQDEVTKEVSDEKVNIFGVEEFLYGINDDNEDMDLFQSHFSQCSQEQEMGKEETPRKKKIKSTSNSTRSDVCKKKETKTVKSPKSKGKDKRIRDVRVKLKRLDLESLSKGIEISEEKGPGSDLDIADNKSAPDALKNNTKIVNLETVEKVKCLDTNSGNLESYNDALIKDQSDIIIESDKKNLKKSSTSSIEESKSKKELSSYRIEKSSNKKKSGNKPKAKTAGVQEISMDLSPSNCSKSKNKSLDKIYNENPHVEKPLSTAFEPNENCPPSNLIKKDLNKHFQIDERDKISLPPPDSISGAKLVKSTLLSKPPTEVRKKPGRPKKTESSVTRESLNKRKQKQIIEDRKAKLKLLALEANSKLIDNGQKDKGRDIAHKNEVAQKRTVDEEKASLLSINPKDDNLVCDKSIDTSGSPDNKSVSMSKAIGVAKITERNRGSILLEGFLEDPCRKTRMKKKVEKANSALIASEPVAKRSESCDKSKEPSFVKAAPIVTLPRVASSGLKSCLRVEGRRSSNKKVEFDLKMNVKLFECEGILHCRSVNAMGLKDKAPSTPYPKPLAGLPIPAITTLEETYFDIVHWNASWINEIKVIPGEPPVHADKYNCKDSYVSYKDYKRWLYPLMLYELWANMCKTMDDEDANKTGRAFDGIVLESLQFNLHPTNGKNLLILKCFFPLYGKQAQNMVESMDILIIKALSACEGKRIFFVMFGLVYSGIKMNSYRDTTDPVARQYLTTLNRKPDVCAYFDIIIYKSQKKQLTTGFQLRIRPTYNMMTELREFESLIKLASSPLSHIIIDPVKNNSVYLQKDMNNKIVTEYPLNEDQRRAILCSTQSVFANRPSISLIHGPPGTGKTQVIVSIVEQLLYRFKLKNNYKRKKILICSHSNTAIDEICLRLLDIRQRLPREKRFKLTRFGRVEKMHPKVSEIQTTTLARKEVEKRNLNEEFNLELSLMKAKERMVANSLENPESPRIENYKRKYEQVQKRIACLEFLVKNKESNNETVQKEIERMVFDEEMKVILFSDIIATTLGSCAQRRITKAFSEMSRSEDERREVSVCIIDEATQATEADSLLPLVYDVKNFILVGDPQQLPPFVASQTAKKFGLCQSLFARLYKVWNGIPSAPVYMLKDQHRMHPEIAKFPSKAFYNGQLTTPSFLAIKRPFKPYAVITHTLVQDSNELNRGEARLIVDMAEKLLLEPGMKGLSIGLIVPYQRQRLLIQDLFVEKKLPKHLSVNTIDSYQGQERDVILLSVVRTTGVGFLVDPQRLNVALTRAKKAMYIVGNFISLQTSDIWKELLTDAKERNLHFDAGRAENVESIFEFLFERNTKRSRTSNS